MKPVVVTSIEDESGQRCVDVLRTDGGFAISECRRDPEDGNGWFRLVPLGEVAFATSEAALAHARATIGWIT